MDKSSANLNDNSQPTAFIRMCNGHSLKLSVNTAVGLYLLNSSQSHDKNIVNLKWVVIPQGREHQCSSESALDTLKRKSTHE